MKKRLFFILMLTALYSITIGQDFKRYQFKSGKVVYKMSGIQTGTETLYFDDYGRKEVHFNKSVIDMMGVKQKSNTQTIMEGKYIYTIDLEKNTGQKMENPLYEMFSDEDDLQKVGEDIMKKMGGKKVGTETLNGKECEISEVQKMGGKIWVWNSLAIRTVVNMMGMNITQEAESIETDIDVSPDLFKIPKGIEIKDIGTIENLMGK
ncbi:MAG: hypothetical protein KAI45_00495 [Melioribacteraceae bacterium]|nr:hypothetical protein [Melioribacteraceae bacterium]